MPAELEVHQDAIRQWFRYKRDLGKPVSTASLKATFTRMAKLGDHLPESLQDSEANGWQGFFESKGNGSRPEDPNEAAKRLARKQRME